MIRRVLLINSDLAKNRGDRAIAEGNIALIKTKFPQATITGISQYPERDREWYGIEFLDMNFQSLSPIELLRLCKEARDNDIVLWGGGEILKDYTNKAALWYWVIKMTFVSIANPRLYGAYQGIGPTGSSVSKRLIAYIANRCKSFIVRDDESKEKLIAWGASPEKILAASDPAVVPVPDKPSEELKDKLAQEFSIDDAFLSDFVCIGPREWFHYKPSGILPFKYKKKLNRLLSKNEAAESERHKQYIKHIKQLVHEITTTLNKNVLLVPMHMEESDTELCELLAANVNQSSMVRIAKADTLSPAELRSLIGSAKAMVGFRLHSNIIGISANVPSLNIYYVDKGRVFFDQIGQQKYALPIEKALEPSFPVDACTIVAELINKGEAIKKEIAISTKELRTRVTSTFDKVFSDA